MKRALLTVLLLLTGLVAPAAAWHTPVTALNGGIADIGFDGGTWSLTGPSSPSSTSQETDIIRSYTFSGWVSQGSNCGAFAGTGGGTITTDTATITVTDLTGAVSSEGLVSFAGNWSTSTASGPFSMVGYPFLSLADCRVEIQRMVFTQGTGLGDPIDGDEACGDEVFHVDRVRGDGGGYSYEVDVHNTPTDVEVCIYVTSPSGQLVYQQDVVVPKDTDPTDYLPPYTPPTIESDAPDGEGPGSPCTSPVGTGQGTDSVRGYARTGQSGSDTVVCVGFRGPSVARHVRVTVH